jgi:hypothetical protein
MNNPKKIRNNGASDMQKFHNLFVIIVWVFLFSALSKTGFSEAADTYHVIHVNGTIQIRASGKLLEVGDKISSEDEIVFKTPDAAAAVISAEKGRFILRVR